MFKTKRIQGALADMRLAWRRALPDIAGMKILSILLHLLSRAPLAMAGNSANAEPVK